MGQDVARVVKQAQQGREYALGELYDRFAPLVRTVCFDRTGDWHAMWDLTHEVFVAAFRGLERLREPRQFQHWLLGITRNKLADHLADRMRDRQRHSGVDMDELTGAQQPSEYQSREQLRAAITELPDEQRYTLQLFYLEGLSAQQIVSLLGMPLRTVYAHLARGRETLKCRLANHQTELAS